MARFTDLLAEISGGDGYPDDFAAQITGAYDEDMSEVNTALAERDATIATLNDTITGLRSRNATLMQSVPVDPVQPESGGSDPDIPEDVTVNDLFPTN